MKRLLKFSGNVGRINAMNRRFFLAVTASVLASVILTIILPFRLLKKIFKIFSISPWLNEHEIKTLTSIAECIYPKDNDPGASELGIKEYFIRQLKTRYYEKDLSKLKNAVFILNSASLSISGVSFYQNSKKIKGSLLNDLAANKIGRYRYNASEVFSIIIDITIEGCFSHPIHGGNKSKNGWEIIKTGFNGKWFDV
ncbi:MAG: gluconate 2-dehydrogenase subunit 3 family protein [bacterium]